MFGTYRTFLAMMVVFQHLGKMNSTGAYAVFGFYILSGYLMTFIMQNNYGYRLSGISKYATNRFLRIYPIYWVSLVFSVILILLVGETFSSGYNVSLYYPQNITEAVRNILPLFSFRGDYPKLIPQAWTLTVEIFFYILIGLGLSKNKRLVSYWLAISLIYHLIAIFMEFGWEKRYFTIPAASLPFATGAFIYHFKYLILTNISSISGKAEEHLPFILIYALILNWYAGLESGHVHGIFFYTNYILCSLMIVVLSERKTLPFITKKIDQRIGNYSYPIYLIHMQVGLVVSFFLGITGVECNKEYILITFLSIPLIFIIAWMFIVVIEQPINLIRARVKRDNIKKYKSNIL